MLPLIGSHRLACARSLYAVKPSLGIHEVLQVPIDFWVSTADWMVVLVPVLGLIAASSIIVGALGSYAAWAFLSSGFAHCLFKQRTQTCFGFLGIT